MKIVCVCGMGMGSSLIAKMNIESILKKYKIDCIVDNCDVGSVASVDYDWYITTKELSENMPMSLINKTIILSDFINLNSIEKELSKYLNFN